MKITSIQQAKKRSDRVNVFADDEFVVSLGKDQLLELGLFKGKELTAQELEKLHQAATTGKVNDRMLNFLQRRPRSIAEARQYLLYKLQLEAETVEAMLKHHIAKGYLDDEEFARWWLRQRLEFKSYGLRKIRAELQQKGIDQVIIDKVCTGVDEADTLQLQTDAQELARKYLRKYRQLEKSQQKQKLFAYLAGRGYDFALIKDIIASEI